MDFDQHAANYSETLNRSLASFGETTEYFARLKADHLVACVGRALGPTERLSCLDVGCGTGITEQFLGDRFRELSGCDPSGKMLDEARLRVSGVRYALCVPGQPLPYSDGHFDVVFTYCTMHHIPPPELPAFVDEMVRVTRPGGLVVTFEHNPYNPLTRAVVRGCEFDTDAILITPPEALRLFSASGLVRETLNFYIFFPRVLGFMRPLERFLGWLPLGGQYYLAGKRAA